MKSKNQTKMELRAIDLLPIVEYVDEYHEGNLLSLSNWLDSAIYMFHYLPEDVFTAHERQDICHILRQLKEVFVEIYSNQNNW
ncbi:hypothetical protein [uncultured Croceitalea sp.]|uniref:hypothetical protein n=1 Tax=uncultured Croceitalea sp. TaxID=1798908 RepID=UPI00374F8123